MNLDYRREFGVPNLYCPPPRDDTWEGIWKRDEDNRRMAEFIERYTRKATKPQPPPTDKLRDALIDIAYDTPTIEKAQQRAREALK